MRKVVFLIDPGHGGMINGKYQTAGKRSPKLPDGSTLYEGVNNRDNARILIEMLKKEGLDAIDIVNSEQDVTLGERVRRANNFAKKRKCLYVSLHSNAAGNGKEFHPAKGISVFTSKGETKSDYFAEIALNNLIQAFKDTMRFRFDRTDGDKDKEADFYVLKNTKMPAVLFELGFHTNLEEVLKIQTREFKTSAMNAIVKACIQFESNY